MATIGSCKVFGFCSKCNGMILEAGECSDVPYCLRRLLCYIWKMGIRKL